MPVRRSHRPDVTTFWKRLPIRSRLELLSAVALLFSSVGFITDLSALNPHRPGWVVATQVAYAGLIAAGYAIAFLWSMRLLAIVIVLQVVGIVVLREVLPGFWDAGAPVENFADLRRRAAIDAIGILACVVSSYVLFIRFITREGIRHVRLDTEARLARAVQDQLVPPLSRRWGRFEVEGSSAPSSEIGGDLVDLYEVDGRAVACLADVSGHGIPAGSLMGMVKTASRMSLLGGAGVDRMLTDLNRVLGPLKTPDRFVTLAAIELRDGDRVQVALAGHLPILHVRRDGAVARVENQHLPVGVAPETDYRSVSVAVAPGDLLVVVSDGITEVTDANGGELGIDGVERLVGPLAGGTPRAVAEAILAAARSRGPQEDDQSVLVVRVG
jgi:serine phosphatase RsbU (regulator of sigma subunit)